MILFNFNLNCSDDGNAPQAPVVRGKIDFQEALLANPNVQKFASERKLSLTLNSLTHSELFQLFLALKKHGVPALESFTYEQMKEAFTTHMAGIFERQLRVAATSASKYLSHDKMLEIIAKAIKPTDQES